MVEIVVERDQYIFAFQINLVPVFEYGHRLFQDILFQYINNVIFSLWMMCI